MKKLRKYSANPVRNHISNGAKKVFRKKTVFLQKTKFRVQNVAARLEHRKVEGKRKK